MTPTELALYRATLQWEAELRRLQRPQDAEPEEGLTIDALVTYLRGQQKQ